jgi:hypothetical protein
LLAQAPRQPSSLLKHVVRCICIEERVDMLASILKAARSIIMASAATALAAGTAACQIDGRLILDNSEIPSCAPLSGVIEIRSHGDSEIPGTKWQSISMRRGACEFVITTPQDSVLVIGERAASGGATVCYGPVMGTQALNGGLVYAIPVFLLRTDAGFIFEAPGRYVIVCRLSQLPGRPECTAELRVTEASDEERQVFTSAFPADAVIVEPFCNTCIKSPHQPIATTSPYADALRIAQAHLDGRPLLVHELLDGTLAECKSGRHAEWLLNEENTDQIARGVLLDSALEHPRGIWHVLQQRQLALRSGEADMWVESVDAEGRIIVVRP